MNESVRRTAKEIFEVASEGARDELSRPVRELAFSGVSAGLMMGLTALGVALVRSALGDSKPAELASFVLYPLGFIAVIIGRGQLFTENTLYPVLLVLDERRHLAATARLWATVFLANIVGASLFALLAVRSGALHGEVVETLSQLGVKATEPGLKQLFWSGVMGGWLIALVAWLVAASHWTIAQVVLIWAVTLVVGAAHLAHCIAGSAEVLSAVFHGALSLGDYVSWLVPATLGNIVGGVLMVSALNYGQVAGEILKD